MYGSRGGAASAQRAWECTGSMGGQTGRDTSVGGEVAGETRTPDGVEGMLAVWALLNISTHHQGRVMVCKKGLYTLLRLVQRCPDPQRVSVVAAVLENLTAAVENTAMVYRAELRLKHAALLNQAGLKRVHRERQPPSSSRPSSTSPHAAEVAGADVNALGSKQQQQHQQQRQSMAPASAYQHGPRATGSGVVNAIMGFFEPVAASPPRTSRLSIAADTACLVANMCNTSTGPPKKISSEDEKVNNGWCAYDWQNRVSHALCRSCRPCDGKGQSCSAERLLSLISTPVAWRTTMPASPYLTYMAIVIDLAAIIC